VVEAIKASLLLDGLQLVSRADNGDHFRQVVPNYEMARDPKLARIARLGDMILTARVNNEGAAIHAGFTGTPVGADYRLDVAPGPDGRGSLVTIVAEVAGDDSAEGEQAELARNLRRVIREHARQILAAIVDGSRASRNQAP
jgi:hypothetical protein